MNRTPQSLVLDTVVRMVVPMRREFGWSLDVMAFMRDAAYARQVIAKALESQEKRLRDYAAFVDQQMRDVLASVVTPTVPAPVTKAETRLADHRRLAVRLLIDLVGPVGESVAIRIERAPDAAALAQATVQAQQLVTALRGAQAGRDYLIAVTPARVADSSFTGELA